VISAIDKTSQGLKYGSLLPYYFYMTQKLLDPVLLQTDIPNSNSTPAEKSATCTNSITSACYSWPPTAFPPSIMCWPPAYPTKAASKPDFAVLVDFLSDIVANHLITADVAQYPQPLQKYADQLAGRSMIVQRAQMFPVECVVRGYISGSAWKEYKATGKVCGINLPAGLRESDAFPEPIFTPSTKATSGHDENIPFSKMCDIVGTETASTLRDLTLRVYKKAADYARQRGIIIADTKFEFGMTARGITLADEVLTRIRRASGLPINTLPAGRRSPTTSNTYAIIWKKFIGNKQPPAPALPSEVARHTSDKYLDAYQQITGHKLDV